MITPADLAAHRSIPVQRVAAIARGERGVRTEIAWLLAEAFGITPQFWMNLHTMDDIGSPKPDGMSRLGEMLTDPATRPSARPRPT